MNKNNITIIGMSGVGKTAVGNELANTLTGYDFIDTDKEIEIYAGQNIPKIFEEFGEQFFRRLEKDIIKRVLKSGMKQVISLGGGAFEDEITQKILLDNTTVIYLKATAEDIIKRLNNNGTGRPLLNNISVEKINSIMQKRISNYEKAHITIDTTEKSVYNIVKEIKNLWLRF